MTSSSQSGVCPPGMNPIDWVLEVDYTVDADEFLRRNVASLSVAFVVCDPVDSADEFISQLVHLREMCKTRFGQDLTHALLMRSKPPDLVEKAYATYQNPPRARSMIDSMVLANRCAGLHDRGAFQYATKVASPENGTWRRGTKDGPLLFVRNPAPLATASVVTHKRLDESSDDVEVYSVEKSLHKLNLNLD